MRIKTTMRYCLTGTRMAILKRHSVGDDVEKLDPPVPLMERQNGAVSSEKHQAALQNVKHRVIT